MLRKTMHTDVELRRTTVVGPSFAVCLYPRVGVVGEFLVGLCRNVNRESVQVLNYLSAGLCTAK